jgi:hypothetical protein
MFNWFKYHSISILNDKWEVIKPDLSLKYIPRGGELIYLNDQEKYFKVINVVHNLTDKQNIFIVVSDYEETRISNLKFD